MPGPVTNPSCRRCLIIHTETQYLGGAEKMLHYYLEGLVAAGVEATLAAIAGSKVWAGIPPQVRQLPLANAQQFSLPQLWRQAQTLARAHRQNPFQVAHAWMARAWELGSLLAWRSGIPTLGTLHDHPQAPFISPGRQKLMRASARWGLKKIAVVSGAVHQACVAAGYPPHKLAVIHNGLPLPATPALPRTPASALKLGFLGAFSERKGLHVLFEICDRLSRLTPVPWALYLAGGPQDDAGNQLMSRLRARYETAPWWPRLHWLGWVDRPLDFLASLDCLLVTSSEFDPFPTVLLEAGLVGVPVLASRVGGVPEIILENQNGWLFAAGGSDEAAQVLAGLAGHPGRLVEAGLCASRRIRTTFNVQAMVDNYLHLYSQLAPAVG